MITNSERAFESRFNARVSPLAPAVRALAARDAEILATQLKLARVAAPTGLEGARGKILSESFVRLGFDTKTSEVGNVIATRPTDAEGSAIARSERDTESQNAPVVCLAHLDTVFPESTDLTVTHEHGRYSCPGIGDNCRGLAALLAIAEVIGANSRASSGWPLVRPIEFVATVGEEGLGNLLGAQHYFRARDNAGQLRPHAVIVLDGPGDTNIVHHGLGSRRYRISFNGAGGHSWADFGSPNAVHAAARAATWLAELPRTLQHRFALTVSRIGGGESVNAIPADAFLDVDVRGTDEHVLNVVDGELRRLVDASAAGELTNMSNKRDASKSLTARVELTGARPTGSLSADHPLVQAAQFATRIYNIEPASAIASTDANVPLSLGIPAITIGAGGVGGGAHTLHEWYENTNGSRGLARALTVVMAMAS